MEFTPPLNYVDLFTGITGCISDTWSRFVEINKTKTNRNSIQSTAIKKQRRYKYMLCLTHKPSDLFEQLSRRSITLRKSLYTFFCITDLTNACDWLESLAKKKRDDIFHISAKPVAIEWWHASRLIVALTYLYPFARHVILPDLNRISMFPF